MTQAATGFEVFEELLRESSSRGESQRFTAWLAKSRAALAALRSASGSAAELADVERASLAVESAAQIFSAMRATKPRGAR